MLKTNFILRIPPFFKNHDDNQGLGLYINISHSYSIINAGEYSGFSISSAPSDE